MPLSEITDEEAAAMGIDNIVLNNQFLDPDSPIVIADMQARSSSMPAVDPVGRPIISYKQYLEFSEVNADISRYALRMTHKTKGGIFPIQASKLNAWVGRGYLPVGLKPAAPKVTPKRVPSSEPEVEVFFCNVKYPDCGRFFDTSRGLTRHWSLDHEKDASGKPGSQRKTKPAQAVADLAPVEEGDEGEE